MGRIQLHLLVRLLDFFFLSRVESSRRRSKNSIEIWADHSGGLAIATADELGIMGVVMIAMIAVATGVVIE